MDNKEAIEILLNKDAHGMSCGYTGGYLEARNKAIDALEYLEKNKKWIDLLNIFAESCDFDVNKIMWNTQGWIPCSERLPNGQTEVVVSCSDDSGDTPFNYTSFGWVTNDGEYWIVDNEINNFVIAWMPLPKPCKEN